MGPNHGSAWMMIYLPGWLLNAPYGVCVGGMGVLSLRAVVFEFGVYPCAGGWLENSLPDDRMSCGVARVCSA